MSHFYQVLDDRKGTHNADRACCKDCRHLHGYVSWWCQNPTANSEGKRTPCHSHCAQWEPCLTRSEVLEAFWRRSFLHRLFTAPFRLPDWAVLVQPVPNKGAG